MRSSLGFRSGSDLLAVAKRGQTASRNFCLRAGRIEADKVFVELFRVDQVVLPLLQLGCFQQLLGLVTARSQHKTQEENEDLAASAHSRFSLQEFLHPGPPVGHMPGLVRQALKFVQIDIDMPTRRGVELTPRIEQIQTGMIDMSQRAWIAAPINLNEVARLPKKIEKNEEERENYADGGSMPYRGAVIPSP
jgi:hypothetical protein